MIVGRVHEAVDERNRASGVRQDHGPVVETDVLELFMDGTLRVDGDVDLAKKLTFLSDLA